MVKRFFAVIFLLSGIASAIAGDLKDGVWTPSKVCGIQDDVPRINANTTDDYNASIKTITDWEKKASDSVDCVFSDANADNVVIAKTAKAEQDKLKALVDKVNSDLKDALIRINDK